ncbi:hypothetical protein CEUSTIGMA_g2693.t1 [Chlamydomonas eustigma]|uniref:Uncharacterized protein n=1 Tax=Chlamydomonas eustigma TaxID=1157962 RepID=A0A250WWN6_9CHLO|nr:hypothetical protein CEUSTIGMA_g2693.t1 [Chlamydomonas eustigma]|eukprot:GAX75248.1 hypothetical protein CEUSTIGMA_g2693.t1 [Chlamydomonas eustigma]
MGACFSTRPFKEDTKMNVEGVSIQENILAPVTAGKVEDLHSHKAPAQPEPVTAVVAHESNGLDGADAEHAFVNNLASEVRELNNIQPVFEASYGKESMTLPATSEPCLVQIQMPVDARKLRLTVKEVGDGVSSANAESMQEQQRDARNVASIEHASSVRMEIKGGEAVTALEDLQPPESNASSDVGPLPHHPPTTTITGTDSSSIDRSVRQPANQQARPRSVFCLQDTSSARTKARQASSHLKGSRNMPASHDSWHTTMGSSPAENTQTQQQAMQSIGVLKQTIICDMMIKSQPVGSGVSASSRSGSHLQGPTAFSKHQISYGGGSPSPQSRATIRSGSSSLALSVASSYVLAAH